MTIDYEGLARGVAQALGDSVIEPVPVLLGNPEDQSVSVPLSLTDTPGMVWIHGIGGDPQSVSMALNGGANAIPREKLVFGTPVKVRKVQGRYILAGPNDEAAEEYFSGVNPKLPEVIAVEQLDFGRLHETVPTPSMKAVVSAAIYVVNNVLYRVPELTTADMSASPTDVNGAAITIPSTHLRAKAVLVQVNAASKTLSYKQSSEFDSLLTHEQAFDAGLYPQPQSGAGIFAAGWIKLVNGMADIRRGVNLYAHPELLSEGGPNRAGKLYLHQNYFGLG